MSRQARQPPRFMEVRSKRACSSMEQENTHRRVSPKSDDSKIQFATQILIVVFGGDVRRTEGVAVQPLSRLPHGGEAFCSSSQIFSWKLNCSISQKRIQLHALSPAKRPRNETKGVGRGASRRADQYVYLGEVKPTCRLLRSSG